MHRTQPYFKNYSRWFTGSTFPSIDLNVSFPADKWYSLVPDLNQILLYSTPSLISVPCWQSVQKWRCKTSGVCRNVDRLTVSGIQKSRLHVCSRSLKRTPLCDGPTVSLVALGPEVTCSIIQLRPSCTLTLYRQNGPVQHRQVSIDLYSIVRVFQTVWIFNNSPIITSNLVSLVNVRTVRTRSKNHTQLYSSSRRNATWGTAC